MVLKIPLLLCVIGSTAIVGAGGAAVEWASYNGNLLGDRFSPLALITPKNVGSLREVCEMDLGDPGALQAAPLAIGDTLFVTTTHTLAAVNAADCSLRWRYVYKTQANETWPVNRGAAYSNGRLFRGTGDGRLLAIDAVSGREIWRATIADPSTGEFLSGAPVAWNGLVYTGPGGGDFGIKGRISAFDEKTGRQIWQFHSIPLPGDVGYDSWQVPASAARGGGGTWSSFALDSVTDELFVPVGNPAPAYRPDVRPGQNLFTNSLVVLDARTGALKWYFQLEANDGFDYDLGASPVLYTDRAGKRRVALGSKDGHLYIIDRDSHKLISRTAITTISKPAGPPTPSGVRACPGTNGGVEWNGPAFSPASNMVYVGSVNWCWYFFSGEPHYEPGVAYMGAGPVYKSDKSRTGWVYALDAGSGRPIWRYHAGSPVLSGVTPTAGGVVFSGESSGNLLAFDAHDGKLLYSRNLGGSMGGGVITYEVGEKQYVATTAGNSSRAGLSSNGDFTPRLIVMTTGLDSSYQPSKTTALMAEEASAQQEPRDPDGKAVYAQYCASCHGSRGTGGQSAPSLRGEADRKTLYQVVQWIKNPPPPMPKLAPPLIDSQIDAVARFVEELK